MDIENISQIVERESRLYLVDDRKGVYVFDIYGSLLNHYERETIIKVDASSETVFMLFDRVLKLVIYDFNTEFIIPLPMEDIIDFRYCNQHYYFRTSQHVHNFSLQIVE